jgi:hypothetical protein
MDKEIAIRIKKSLLGNKKKVTISDGDREISKESYVRRDFNDKECSLLEIVKDAVDSFELIYDVNTFEKIRDRIKIQDLEKKLLEQDEIEHDIKVRKGIIDRILESQDIRNMKIEDIIVNAAKIFDWIKEGKL